MFTIDEFSKGWPLEEALKKAFPKKYADFKNVSNSLMLTDPIASRTGLGLLCTAFESFTRPERRERLEGALINLLQSGELVVLAYKAPFQKGDYPVQISPNLLKGYGVNWEKSHITLDHAEYLDVRVFKKSFLDKFIQKSAKVLPIEKQRPAIKERAASVRGKGRPSLKADIRRTYLELCEEGRINFKETKSRIFKQIAAYVAAELNISLNPRTNEYRGLGETAIRNAVGDLVDIELKKSSS